MKSIMGAVITFCLALSGCAMGTKKLDEIKDRPDAEVASFMVKMNYQDVYRKILESGQVPSIEGKSALYTDLKIAKVWIQPPIYFNDYFALIEIQFDGSNSTKMNYYCLTPGFKGWCRSIQELFTEATRIQSIK